MSDALCVGATLGKGFPVKRDNSVRELTDDEILSVGGGEFLGALPGYKVEIPALLFQTPNIVCISLPGGGGIIWNQPG